MLQSIITQHDIFLLQRHAHSALWVILGWSRDLALTRDLIWTIINIKEIKQFLANIQLNTTRGNNKFCVLKYSNYVPITLLHTKSFVLIKFIAYLDVQTLSCLANPRDQVALYTKKHLTTGPYFVYNWAEKINAKRLVSRWEQIMLSRPLWRQFANQNCILCLRYIQLIHPRFLVTSCWKY